MLKTNGITTKPPTPLIGHSEVHTYIGPHTGTHTHVHSLPSLGWSREPHKHQYPHTKRFDVNTVVRRGSSLSSDVGLKKLGKGNWCLLLYLFKTKSERVSDRDLPRYDSWLWNWYIGEQIRPDQKEEIRLTCKEHLAVLTWSGRVTSRVKFTHTVTHRPRQGWHSLCTPNTSIVKWKQQGHEMEQ